MKVGGERRNKKNKSLKEEWENTLAEKAGRGVMSPPDPLIVAAAITAIKNPFIGMRAPNNKAWRALSPGAPH